MSKISHSLGIGNGSLIEDTENGRVQYRPTGKIMPAFNIRIADVTGVSWRKKDFLKVFVTIHGQGTVLAEVEVYHSTSEKIDDWFTNKIGLGATRTSESPTNAMSDELLKLAELHKKSILTDDEFTIAKKKIIQ
ncbi:MAG: SHOCT domain-containing protein [Bacteroidota bacterium]